VTACGLCDEDTDGRYLCDRHTVRLTAVLEELPVLYAEVAECLVPRRSTWGEIIATRGAAGPRSPLNEDVLDTVNAVRADEVVYLWRVDVQRERWPQHGAPAPAGLHADCRWLAAELDWIVEHYAPVGELAREVHDLERQARQAVGDPAPRAQHIGVCVAVTDPQGTVCGAALTRLPGRPVRCRACRTEYRTEQDLLLLRHYQPQPESDGSAVSC
jgi:hypothetical protein